MNTSTKGADLIKSFEGCKLKAYKDPGTVNGLPITIGWGSTMYQDGSKIKLGDVITQAKADELLKWEIEKKANVLRALNMKLKQHQFDAVVSFCYNVGLGAFNTSTLRKKINLNPDDPTISCEFLRWINNNGKPMAGLKRRREAEIKLYFNK